MAKKRRSNRSRPKGAKPSGATPSNPELGDDDERPTDDDTPRDDAKRDDAKRDDASSKADTKRDDAKRDDASSKADTKRDDAKRDDAKHDSKRDDASSKADTKRDDAKRGDAKHDSKRGDAKRDDAKRDVAKRGDAKHDSKRGDSRRGDAMRGDAKHDSKRGDSRRGQAAPETEASAWFGVDVSWTKLAVTRVVLFALLALDALLSIRHAPRYGATDFNVAHFGFLDSIGPGRVGYGVGQLICAFLFALIVFGVGTRVALPIATVIYGWLYFGSQLDSYQHHYLVFLVLAIGCFVPWQRPANPEAPVRSAAVRLLLVQLAIMYFWAAISKLDAQWINGAALEGQLSGAMKSLGDKVGFSTLAVMVIATELVLAAIVWIKRAWIVAAPVGLMFHVGIAMTGLEIGLFAFLMVAIYALVVPDAVWETLARPFAALGVQVRGVLERRGFAAIAIGVAVGTAVAVIVRLPNALGVAIAMAAFTLLVALARGMAVTRAGATRGPIAAAGIAHVVAIVLWLIVDRASTVSEDYYRFWGGSQRRLGDNAQAETAYRKLTAIAPDKEVGHFHLGRILISTNRTQEGIEELHVAQRVDPVHARAFVEEARYLARVGKLAEALAKAREAVAAEPTDAEAKALLDNLTKSKPLPPARKDPE